MRLADYLKRTGISGALEPTVDALSRLHLAHRETFLFENLTIQAGGRISVAVEEIERKFLDAGGGGYCFEHNTLFSAVLGDVGFTPSTLLGRVRRGPPERWARTHMVLRVPIADSVWLADVGFGGLGLLEPIPLRDGVESLQGGLTYRLRTEDGRWVLSARDRSTTSDLYEFTEDPQTMRDVEIANYYTSTHPESPFRRTLTIQRSGPNERVILRGDTLTRIRDGRTIDERVERSHLRSVARREFGVELPAGPLVADATLEV